MNTRSPRSNNTHSRRISLAIGSTTLALLLFGAYFVSTVTYVATIRESLHFSAESTMSKTAASEPSTQETVTALPKKPLFVLHVGLPKTGTTFIQSSLPHSFRHAPSMWQEDNFYYLGAYTYLDTWRPSEGGLNHTRNEVFREATSQPQLTDQFVSITTQLAQQQRNVFYTEEYNSFLSTEQLQILHQYLMPNWNVQLIVAYRRFYEHVISAHQQILGRLLHPTWNVHWPGHNGVGRMIQPYDVSTKDVQAELDRHHQTYSTESVHHATKFEREYAPNAEHPAAAVVNKYRTVFGNVVSVISMHHLPQVSPYKNATADPMVHHFFCDNVLAVQTPNLCNETYFSMNPSGNSAKASNSFKEFWPMYLADGAYLRGYLTNRTSSTTVNTATGGSIKISKKKKIGVTRHEMAIAIARHFKNNLLRDKGMIPHTRCLSHEKLKRLEHTSWVMEQKLLNASSGVVEEADHQSGFQSYIDKGKFCSLDVDATLAIPAWQRFLARFTAIHP